QLATVLFDDGYKDNIEYAAPVLQQLNCPASFYVVSDCINRNIPTWTYIIDHALQNTCQQNLQLNLDYVPEKLKHISLHGIHPSLKELMPWMKSLPNKKRKEVMNVITNTCSDVITPQYMMSWNDIRQLHASGFEIGSHSHTHPMLGRLEDEKEISEELQISY